MATINSKIKLLKGYELFDNEAYKKCVDEYKTHYVDISSSKIAELSQNYLIKEIDPKMIERLYKGELKQLKTEKIDALQRVFEDLKALPRRTLVFRKLPTTPVVRNSPLLNDIQTRNLISLHLNSASHFMFVVAENIINSGKTHNRSSFHEVVEAFLNESRILCDVFESQKLGNIYEFLKQNFDDLIDQYTDEALDEIINSDKEKTAKIELIMAFIKKKQGEFHRRVDKALNNDA